LHFAFLTAFEKVIKLKKISENLKSYFAFKDF